MYIPPGFKKHILVMTIDRKLYVTRGFRNKISDVENEPAKL